MPVLIEIIRQGLIGGGSGVVDGARVKITPARANELIDAYVLGLGDQGMVLRETWKLAFVVLDALMNGYEPPAAARPSELAEPAVLA